MLLDQLTLQLKLNGTVLYNGKLEAEALHGEHELIRLEPDQGGTLEFTVSVPKELKNAYALRDTAVKWVFKVEEESPSPMPTEKPEEPGQEQPGNGQTQTGGQYDTSPVKTGDEAAGKLPGLFMELLLSVAAAGTVWYKGAKKR
ncbi:MAG: hypothetical protein KBT01_01680 [Clostridiales bacterium]|nr:hypothetical protein [Candidatus Blautia equi]